MKPFLPYYYCSEPGLRDTYGFVIPVPPTSPSLPEIHSPSPLHELDYRNVAGDKLPKDGIPPTIRGEVINDEGEIGDCILMLVIIDLVDKVWR